MNTPTHCPKCGNASLSYGYKSYQAFTLQYEDQELTYNPEPQYSEGHMTATCKNCQYKTIIQENT